MPCEDAALLIQSVTQVNFLHYAPACHMSFGAAALFSDIMQVTTSQKHRCWLVALSYGAVASLLACGLRLGAWFCIKLWVDHILEALFKLLMN